ncbi:allergen Tha p 1-like [Diorhabda sublineata]|uniref:allergen Tha p 1-like n=1 Tax=Diorhabda sublineata TaxID=1163346 RepID=UPI0024E182DF|nr:allergen Tha p 1-like [Diorhabda sublineata]
MNSFCVSFSVGLLIIVVVSGAPKTYEENLAILKKVELKDILKNTRIMRAYIDCVVHNTHCTPEGIALKESWKEFLDKKCDTCDDEEKKNVKIITKYIYTKQPDWYKEIIDALDADKKYTTKYQAEFESIANDPTIEIPL